MKKLLIVLILALSLLALTGCGEKRIVHCDRCGKEVKVEADSNITDDWIIFCKECEQEIGPVVIP